MRGVGHGRRDSASAQKPAVTDGKAGATTLPLNARRVGTEPDSVDWMPVMSIAVATFVMVTSEFLPIGLLTAMSRDLAVSQGRIGLAVTVPGAIAAVAAPALTVLSGRLDRRLLMLGLTVLVIASNLAVALAPNLAVLLIGRVLLGLNVGGFWAVAIPTGRRLVPESYGGRATSIISAGISVGTVCGLPAGALLGDIAGWRVAFAVAGSLGLLVLAAQVMLLPPIPVTHGIGIANLFGLFKGRQARVGLVATLLIAGGHFEAYTYLEPFLRQVARMEQAMITTALVVYGIAGLAGTFLGEAATARSVRQAFAGTALLLGLVVMLAPAVASGGAPTLGLVALWGVSFGAVPICINIWMYQASAEAYEGGSALVVSVFQIALAVGAFGGGLLVDGVGLVSAFVVAGVTVTLASGVIVLCGGGTGLRTLSEQEHTRCCRRSVSMS